jgi:hypothetical protein
VVARKDDQPRGLREPETLPLSNEGLFFRMVQLRLMLPPNSTNRAVRLSSSNVCSLGMNCARDENVAGEPARIKWNVDQPRFHPSLWDDSSSNRRQQSLSCKWHPIPTHYCSGGAVVAVSSSNSKKLHCQVEILASVAINCLSVLNKKERSLKPSSERAINDKSSFIPLMLL